MPLAASTALILRHMHLRQNAYICKLSNPEILIESGVEWECACKARIEVLA